MTGKMGLEEHFAISDTLADAPGFIEATTWADLRERLLDLQDKRLAEIAMRLKVVRVHQQGRKLSEP